MQGVFVFDAIRHQVSPGYQMFIAATQVGISRLPETFGNGGSAETLDRTLSVRQTSRAWYRQPGPGHKREYFDWITEARRPETRK